LGIQGKKGTQFWLRPFFEGRLERHTYSLKSIHVLRGSGAGSVTEQERSHLEKAPGARKTTKMKDEHIGIYK
jgi:hypothetical protein